jgi:hypothetical protein
VVGPTSQADVKPFSADYLEWFHPYKPVPVVKLDPARTTVEVKSIPEALWRLWLWRLCRIRGQVTKNVNGKDSPVHPARVHICEIEPLFRVVGSLPDANVLSLRDDILKATASPTPSLPPLRAETVTPSVLPARVVATAPDVAPLVSIASTLPTTLQIALQSHSAHGNCSTALKHRCAA